MVSLRGKAGLSNWPGVKANRSQRNMTQRRTLLRRIGLLGLAAGAVLIGYRLLAGTELATTLGDPESLHRWVDGIGWLGPVALMGTLALVRRAR